MEGISGVVQPAQLGPGGFEYQSAREWMTGEVNAAIAGIREAGAAEIVVCDSHGNGQNVLIDKLPEDVRIVRGFPRPLEMMQGIDESFAAAVFIGYHGSEWAAGAVRGHTISSARLLGIKLNGTGGLGRHLQRRDGGPVRRAGRVRVRRSAGRRRSCSRWRRRPKAPIVKEPYGYHSAMTVTPARGQAMIRDAAKRAMAQARIAAAVPRQRADRARGRLQADHRRRARRVRPRAVTVGRAQRQGHVQGHDRDLEAAPGRQQPGGAVDTSRYGPLTAAWASDHRVCNGE